MLSKVALLCGLSAALVAATSATVVDGDDLIHLTGTVSGQADAVGLNQAVARVAERPGPRSGAATWLT